MTADAYTWVITACLDVTASREGHFDGEARKSHGHVLDPQYQISRCVDLDRTLKFAGKVSIL